MESKLNPEIIDGVDDKFLKFLRSRYSCRNYISAMPTDDEINKIMLAGMLAPSARNIQPIKIYVLKSPEAIAKINEASKCIYGAPLVFIICYDKNECWKSRINEGVHSGEIDASIACTHMMLEAHSLGLGSLWVGLFDKKMTKELFDIPDNLDPIALLDLGYKAPEASPIPMHDTFKDKEDIFTVL